MPLVDIQCPSCSQAMRVDTDQLPDQPATLKCPSCEALMTVEKGQLLASLGLQAAPAQAPAPPAPQTPRAETSSNPGPSPVHKVEVAMSSAPEVLLPPGFALEEGTILPSGVVVVVDRVVVVIIGRKRKRQWFMGQCSMECSSTKTSHC